MVTRSEFERVQEIMGARGKPRMKSHDIALRASFFRCGGCGAMITADEKIKVQKNGNVHRYVYYYCTRRKDPHCSQGRIRVTEKDLERQVMELLESIEIPQEFYEWAMDVLRESNEKESVSRKQITVGQREEYDKCVRMIDALIDMRARGEITEEEFAGRKSALMREKHRLEGLLQDTHQGVDDWLRTADKYFSFAVNARRKFETGTSEEKRELLALLGSNLSLLQGKLRVSLAQPLVLIKKAAPEVKRITERFEPAKSADNTKLLRELYAQSSVRGA